MMRTTGVLSIATVALFTNLSQVQAAPSLATAEGYKAVTGQCALSNDQMKTPKKGIPITGNSADCKYPVYKLQGELADINYFSGDTVYASGQLIDRMVFLADADAKSATYACDFVCKEKKSGAIVGINPVYRFMSKAKK